jgi:hypothetical protein
MFSRVAEKAVVESDLRFAIENRGNSDANN